MVLYIKLACHISSYTARRVGWSSVFLLTDNVYLWHGLHTCMQLSLHVHRQFTNRHLSWTCFHHQLNFWASDFERFKEWLVAFEESICMYCLYFTNYRIKTHDVGVSSSLCFNQRNINNVNCSLLETNKFPFLQHLINCMNYSILLILDQTS